MSSPCSVCCAPPCLLPSNFDDPYSDQTISEQEKRVFREPKCCCNSVRVDNSSFKIFVQRTKCVDPQNDVLLVSQIGGTHKVNFYVVVDHNVKALVIAIRGTMSLGDAITDTNTMPKECEYIDGKPYVHQGIGQCAEDAFDRIMASQAVLQFVQHDEYKTYDVVICGHSLGGGTTVLLSLMMKYGTHDNLKHFVNENRKFRAYAIAPPSCIDREFAEEKQDEIKEFLTCVVYGHDMIPRLSAHGLLTARASIRVLLEELKKTDHAHPWFVYKKAMAMNNNTILEVLPNSKFCNNAQEDAKEEKNMDEDDQEEQAMLPRSRAYFDQIVKEERDKLLQQHTDALLWERSFSQVGDVIFVAKRADTAGRRGTCFGNADGNEYCECMASMCHSLCCSMIPNLVCCRCCLDGAQRTYSAYRARMDLFADRMLFSDSMMTHHMPHLYLDVLERVNKDS